MTLNARSITLLALLYGCAASHSSPRLLTPQTILEPRAPGPDMIPCDKPVVVEAKTDHDGVQAERAWLGEHYPGHSPYTQGLSVNDHRMFDVLTFTSADGRAVSVCFDITAWFGRY